MPDFAFAVDPHVLGVGLLLVAAALVGAAAQRIKLPALLLFLVLGMAVGDDGFGWFRLDDPQLAQSAAVLALLVILFEGGLTTRASDLRRAAVPGFTLATVGVVMTAVVVAAAVWLLTGVSTTTALLIGAVVSSTDAAAVFTVVRRSPLPRRVTSLLEVESGANDPMAVVLTIGVLEAWRSGVVWHELVVFGLVQLVGGAIVGAFVGGVAVLLLRAVPWRASGLLPPLTLGMGAVAYGAAVVLGASGFLAVYVCGLLVGLYAPHQRSTIHNLYQALSGVAEVSLFLLLGLLVLPSALLDVSATALVAAIVLVVVARPLAVHASLAGSLLARTWTIREATLVSWAGLRGAVPIVLATFPLTTAYPEGVEIFHTVFFVVIVSAAVQGSTIGMLTRALGLTERAAVWSPTTEFLPVDDPDVDVVEVHVEQGMRVAGRRLRDVPLPRGARVLTLIRHGAATVADGDSTIEPGDRVIVIAARDPRNDRRLVDWAVGSDTE